MFDRVIVLSEGFTIYNGAPSQVEKFFSPLGLKMTKFSNPADKLSIIASQPRYVLNKDVDIEGIS